ncbi:MAG: ABC transporter substrate-binding protein [Anaerolineaceae bacterium]|nr:ABC transporter substrate-binding protein [Anaerolineaceae bacterium]
MARPWIPPRCASFWRILDEETGAAARSRYTGISAIETPDANTVVFALSEPNVPLPGALASVNAAIISEEAAASGDFSGANGTGAFVLDEWTPEEVTTLSANASWWGRRAERGWRRNSHHPGRGLDPRCPARGRD